MKYIFILLTLFLACAVQAQPGIITGNVNSSAREPLAGASIRLTIGKENKTTITKEDGSFQFTTDQTGTYTFKISHLGFASMVRTITIDHFPFTIPTIQLQPEEKLLQEVQVTSMQKAIQVTAGKTVVNVAALGATGASVLEILKRLPGISLDKDGNISLKGKTGVAILMNDKHTAMSGSDLVNYLNSLPASQLDQIEIMTQPGAKYDASGTGGIINLKTKQQNTLGFNLAFSASYNQGYYPKTTESIAINWRKNKWNIYSNYQLNIAKQYEEDQMHRNFRDINNSILSSLDQYSVVTNKRRLHNLNIGVDYLFGKQTVLGASFTLFDAKRYNESDSRADLNANGFDSVNTAYTHVQQPSQNTTTNLNFKTKLSAQEELKADLDLIRFHFRNEQTSDNHMHEKDGSMDNAILLGSYNPSDYHIYRGQLDYSRQGKNTKWEAGLKTSFINTDNNTTLYNIVGGVTNQDPNSNHYLYSENVNAAYLSAESKLSKQWMIQAGLRLENTNWKGHQLVNEEYHNGNYTKLFPTVFIAYQLNEKNSFSFSYGKRMDRPGFKNLNPFRYFLDRFTYQQGNPMLQPQIAHNIELGYSYNNAVNINLNYTHMTDLMDAIFHQDNATKTTYFIPGNVSNCTNTGISISYNKSLTKWWQLSAFANFFENHYQNTSPEQSFDTKLGGYSFNTNSQFQLGKGFGAQIGAFYNSESLNGSMMISNAQSQLNLSISRQVLSNKGSIRIGWQQPLIDHFEGNVRVNQLDLNVTTTYQDKHQLTLAFNYKFSKNPTSILKHDKKQLEEQNRAN